MARILVANIGSTSFKYRLYEMPEERLITQDKCERIGRPGGECASYDDAIARCLAAIAGPDPPRRALDQLDAVGFKAVHAGPLTGARLVTEDVLRAMEEFAFFAPAHNPPYVAAMRAFRRAAPGLPLVALFETSFFDALPAAATTYAIPHSWTEQLGVRRYGFHGASHQWASERAQALLARRDLRHVSCHLGGSSSLAAIRSGVAVGSSFGASPQSGLPQNDRVGDLDAFAALFVMKRRSLGIDEMARQLAGGAGLAGISGASGDVRDLLAAARGGDDRARLALDVFVGSVRHYLGAFLVTLGGLDALSFSGGIGENSPEVREAVCANLGAFGIQLDPALNRRVSGEASLSRADSSTKILLIPSNEELVVARSVHRLVHPAQ